MSSAFFQICGTDFVRGLQRTFSIVQRQNVAYAEASTSSTSRVRVGSTLTPGPMVEETVMLMR